MVPTTSTNCNQIVNELPFSQLYIDIYIKVFIIAEKLRRGRAMNFCFRRTLKHWEAQVSGVPSAAN